MWRLKIAEGGGPWLRSLNQFRGRQVWEYDEQGGDVAEREAVDKARATFTQNRFEQRHSSDLLMRLQFAKENSLPELPTQLKIESRADLTEEAVTTTLRRALRFYSTLQAHDGHWPGDYGGPMFLMPGLVIVLYVTGSLNTVLTLAHQEEMRRYLYNHQNKDGGWGLHIEGHSTMFGSVLTYVTLRILGDGPEGGEQKALQRGRNWIHKHGGATYITSWGKFWLSVLGVFEWSGNNPTPPEIWMLPYFLPLHPGRMWCHCRMVYLPMSYVYGKRFTGKITELVKALREELFVQKYSEINWDQARNQCAKEDLYYPHPWVQDVLWGTLHKVVEPVLTRWPGSLFRKKALAHTMEHIHYEDENTRYLDIGPVNKVMNMLACWMEDPNSEAFKLHLMRVADYLWVAEDGMKMQGYNGSQLWDTSFAVQALAATKLPDEFGNMLKKANSYIDDNQVREDSPGDMAFWYRHISKGAWPFSTRDHGWPISDCSSEGLKATLILANLPQELVGDRIPAERLYDAVNVILSYQNADGGSATYENTRSYRWLEYINPAETFGDIVIDYSYVECTSACMQALAAFQKQYPLHRAQEIASSISRARKYIESIQKDDGSWVLGFNRDLFITGILVLAPKVRYSSSMYGSWAVCFTYAIWFGVLGLIAAGQNYETSFHIRMACKFLLSKQLPNGGWGESYLSCQDKVYSNLPGGKSHIVNTSWAMLTLMAAGQWERNPEALHRAATSLINEQMKSGDFPQQGCEEDLVDGLRQEIGGCGVPIAVSVQGVHHLRHVQVQSLARLRQRRASQHHFRQLLHCAVGISLQDTAHAADEMHGNAVVLADECFLGERFAGEEEGAADNGFQSNCHLVYGHVLVEGGHVPGLRPFRLRQARREPSVPLQAQPIRQPMRCTLSVHMAQLELETIGAYVCSEMVENVSPLRNESVCDDGVHCFVKTVEENVGALGKPLDQFGIPRPHRLQEDPKLFNGRAVVEVVVDDGDQHGALRPHHPGLRNFEFKQRGSRGEVAHRNFLSRKLQIEHGRDVVRSMMMPWLSGEEEKLAVDVCVEALEAILSVVESVGAEQPERRGRGVESIVGPVSADWRPNHALHKRSPSN